MIAIAEMCSRGVDSMASMMSPRRRLRNATPENPAFSLNDPDAFDAFGGGTESKAGVNVDHGNSLDIAAVWQSVSIISGDMACMPLNVFKILENGDREIDTEHPAQFLVSTKPNSQTSAPEFWRNIMMHALIWGNGFALIQRANRVGRPIAMANLLPDRTKLITDDNGMPMYVSDIGGEPRIFFPQEILHIKGISCRPGWGCDLVEHARDSFGLALAAEGFNSKFFANGAQTGGILQIPPGFTKKAKDNLEEGFSKRYTGEDNWFKTIVLREGATFHPQTVNAEQSQLSESREDQVREVARWFSLPPHKLGLSDSVSYNSVEQSQNAYLQSTLNHWRCTVVAEAGIKLLDESDLRSRIRVLAYDVTELVRTDVKTHNAALALQRQNGAINSNEWRAEIGRNRRTDPGGDTYENPNTSSPNRQQTSEPDGDSGTTEDASTVDNIDRTRLSNAHTELLRDAVNRMGRLVSSSAKKAAKKPSNFLDWIDSGALENQKRFTEAVRPVIEAHASVTDTEVGATVLTLSDRFFNEIITPLDELTKPPHVSSSLASNVDGVCATFTATIADTLIPLVIGQDDEN